MKKLGGGTVRQTFKTIFFFYLKPFTQYVYSKYLYNYLFKEIIQMILYDFQLDKNMIIIIKWSK